MPTDATAPAGPVYVYRAVALRVIDGDTFVARVDLGFEVDRRIHVRLRGINAPEHNRPGGIESMVFLTELLLPDTRDPTLLLLRSYKDQQSFARWICDAWIPEDDGTATDVAGSIVMAGHAVEFDPDHDKWVRVTRPE